MREWRVNEGVGKEINKNGGKEMNYALELERRCRMMDFLEIVFCFIAVFEVRCIILPQFIT
jgi:hypothetical protein